MHDVAKATQDFNLDIGLVSDDAGQCDLFAHGLCWVYAERPLQHLLPLNETEMSMKYALAKCGVLKSSLIRSHSGTD